MKKVLIIVLNVLVFAVASIRLSNFPNDGSLFLKLLYAIVLVKAGFNITKTLKIE
ncbi:hypothetical protein [uncultured Peptoniphilus sp.]|uniref:hypothetical protein n=1 Tax=uncultured Peptoniphilus sp. TaxID=254354 RepID=UPI0025E94E02|nr:hypothetical protein [uncultured Peptoniphilus sp.]